MPKRVALSSNYAVAYAVMMADVDVIAAYPITPQTHVVEKLAEFIANGELDAEMIHVESEHSALSAVVGASAAGARVFTATSSQGLELMHEILHIASGMRLPIVLSLACRSLSAPISIWNDYGDLMNSRDASWVQIVASSAQEAFDSILMAYKIAEDKRVHLPVMVAYDGYILSHTFEPVVLPDSRNEVLEYIPKEVTWYTLDPEKPVTMGPVGVPDWYYEFKYQQVEAMKNAYEVFGEAEEKFYEKFGRKYGYVEEYMLDDAEVAIVTMGALAGTTRVAVDSLRKEGVKAGLLRVRLYRPFPVKEVVKALDGVKVLCVIDKAISFGAPYAGPLYTDTLSSLVKEGRLPETYINVMAGIGQRDVTVDDVKTIAKKALELHAKGVRTIDTIFYGVRGVSLP